MTTLLSEETSFSLPENHVLMGEEVQSGIRVFIHRAVYRAIEAHAKENAQKEVGSMLIGRVFETQDGYVVVIHGHIIAQHTDATAASLTFTHATWEDIHREKEKHYPTDKIVGWQHTHPGYGVFLSAYDLFIQENFFDLPWQVAYVVDPISETCGFFGRSQGKTERLPGFYVYDDARTISITE